jgi:hypothetical protein
VLGLALTALVVGAIGTSFALATHTEAWMDPVGPFEIVGRTIVFAIFGILFLGLFAGLLLLIPAVLWALIMHAALRRF